MIQIPVHRRVCKMDVSSLLKYGQVILLLFLIGSGAATGLPTGVRKRMGVGTSQSRGGEWVLNG